MINIDDTYFFYKESCKDIRKDKLRVKITDCEGVTFGGHNEVSAKEENCFSTFNACKNHAIKVLTTKFQQDLIKFINLTEGDL